MSFEPRGKVTLLLEAMRAEPQRVVWSQEEAAKPMVVSRSMVPNYVAGCCNNGLMHRRTIQGGIELSLQPFEQPEGRPASDLRVPRFGEPFVPPKMVAPRPGSDVRHVNASAGEEPPWPTPAPTPAPAAASVEPELPAAEEPIEQEGAAVEEEEAAVPDAFYSCRTGCIVVTGVEQEPDGSFILPADLVALIKRQITWSPAP